MPAIVVAGSISHTYGSKYNMFALLGNMYCMQHNTVLLIIIIIVINPLVLVDIQK